MKESSRSPAGKSSMAGLRAFLRSRCGSVKAAFHALDVHTVGQLTSDDFARGLHRLGYTEDANAVFHVMDSTGSGLVSLRAFLHYVGGPVAEDESNHLLQSSFNSVSTRSTNRSSSEDGWRSARIPRYSSDSQLPSRCIDKGSRSPSSRSHDFDLPPPMPVTTATPTRAFTPEQKETLEALVREAMKQEASASTQKFATLQEDLSQAVDAFQLYMQETRSSLKQLHDSNRDSSAAMDLIQNRVDQVTKGQEELHVDKAFQQETNAKLTGFREDLNNAVDTFQLFTQEARTSLKQLQDFRRESSAAMEVVQSRMDQGAVKGDAEFETVKAIRPETDISMIKLLAFKDEVSQTLDTFHLFMQETRASMKQLQDSRKESGAALEALRGKVEQASKGAEDFQHERAKQWLTQSQQQEELAQNVVNLQQEFAQLSMKAFKEETSTSLMKLAAFKEDVEQSLDVFQIFQDETRTSLKQLHESRKHSNATLDAIQNRVDQVSEARGPSQLEEVFERLASLEAEVASTFEVLKSSEEQRADTQELAQTVFEFQRELQDLSMKAFKQQTSSQVSRLNAFREDANEALDGFQLFMQETRAALKQLNDCRRDGSAATDKATVDGALAKMQEKAPMRLDEMADRVTSLEAAFQHVCAGAKADVEAMVSSRTEKALASLDSSLARLSCESAQHGEGLEKVQRRQQAFSEEIVKRLKVIVEKLDIKDRAELELIGRSVFSGRDRSPMDSARRTLRQEGMAGGSHCLPVGPALPEGCARGACALEGLGSARSSSLMARVNGQAPKALNAATPCSPPSGSAVAHPAGPALNASPPVQARGLRNPVGSGAAGMKYMSPQAAGLRMDALNSSARRAN